MYVLRLLIVLIFIFGSVQCSSNVSSIYDSDIVIDVDPSNPCTATRECLNCTASRLCLPTKNKLQQVAVIDCSSDPSKPYCDKDTGLCTSVASNGCTSNEFICPLIDGQYPDPRSCTRYHICVNGIRTTNICPRNNVYDASLKDCKLSHYLIHCITISCSGKEGTLFTYPKDDRIYGTCVDGKPYLLGQCKNYEKFDVNSKQCIRVCRGPGKQPTEDCQNYILCAETSRGKYEPVLQHCAYNEGFDEATGNCSTKAECLVNVTESSELNPLPTDPVPTEVEQDSDHKVSELIINNSENKNSNNNVSNGNDNSNGNIVNGNDNGNNTNSGNVGNEEVAKPKVQPLIIINSGDNQNVSNQNNNENGNAVNGNNNSNTANQGNGKKLLPLFVINNAGNNNNASNVSNGNDSQNGNIINGNANSNNSNNVANGNNNKKDNIVKGNSKDDNSNQVNIENQVVASSEVSPLIINNSENSKSDNDVSNGNDSGNGNIINGNGNDNNDNQGNVGNVRKPRSVASPFIINNSENDGSKNDVTNGNDSGNGNIVNGNDNGNNDNQGNVGNVEASKPGIRPRIINNSENRDSDNNVSNGNDNNNGNIVNGNSNGNNSNQGNVGNVEASKPGIRPRIINNSENRDSDNNVSNGNDSGNGNIVNGNGNNNNSNHGNVGNKEVARSNVSPLIINNSENSKSDNDVTNGNDSGNGNIVNGNGNDNNNNQGNVGNGQAQRPGIISFINNSGNVGSDNDANKNSNNNPSNSNDDKNNNLVNVNGDSNNANSVSVGK